MEDRHADEFLPPVFDPAASAEMIEAAKAATEPRIRRWQDRLADRLARFCGSWIFVMSFAALVASWAGWNTFLIGTGAFDPYPYVFLNLCLTVLMSLQGPLILMSQRRTEKQNRRESVSIYALALKAEAEGAQRGADLAAMDSKLDGILRLLEREVA